MEDINKQEQPVEEEKPQEEETEEETVPEQSGDDTEETEESETSESKEKPKEDEEDIDFHTPEEDKPKRTEKEKAEYALKSMISRVEELGGDPTKLIDSKKAEADTSQFVTKRDFAVAETRKVARSEKEVNAIMAWVDKGLSVEEGYLLANKARVKSTFSEIERGNVQMREATGAGQKKPVVKAPAPVESQLSAWRQAGMTYDPVTKIAKGKFTEEYYDGSKWTSRRIQKSA